MAECRRSPSVAIAIPSQEVFSAQIQPSAQVANHNGVSRCRVRDRPVMMTRRPPYNHRNGGSLPASRHCQPDWQPFVVTCRKRVFSGVFSRVGRTTGTGRNCLNFGRERWLRADLNPRPPTWRRRCMCHAKGALIPPVVTAQQRRTARPRRDQNGLLRARKQPVAGCSELLVSYHRSEPG